MRKALQVEVRSQTEAALVIFFFFKILFIHERERGAGRDRQREKQAPCRKPDAGLDPETPGSLPGPKAGAKPLSHPQASWYIMLLCDLASNRPFIFIYYHSSLINSIATVIEYFPFFEYIMPFFYIMAFKDLYTY